MTVICHNAKQAKKVAEMEIKKETRLNRVSLAAGEGFELVGLCFSL